MPMDLSFTIVWRLLLASLLGGMIGLERELHRKPAGLRTNLFICVGSALFTLLSHEVAVRFGVPNDSARIAAQLIPGIGFIGAGAILRERGSVVGLTTAATIFVNSSVGMAVGAGMYWTGTYTALMCLLALSILGWIENRVFKSRVMVFRITSADPEPSMKAANTALGEMKLQMQHFQMYRVGGDFVMEFEADVTHVQQQHLLSKLTGLGAHCEIVPHEAARE
ncbi:MAG: MgtC/SapB family protein [Acidobacteria bacterium]|nr:MgtC/SapB family protein [Acidobacteriota bacterium]MBI3663203.1 MgtC/SapB family protein [Acidobacteriota bacterium]